MIIIVWKWIKLAKEVITKSNLTEERLAMCGVRKYFNVDCATQRLVS